jgi:hypothetical protein
LIQTSVYEAPQSSVLLVLYYRQVTSIVFLKTSLSKSCAGLRDVKRI